MANEMIKFFKGLEASLPAAGTNGALYITTDEGAIYLGTGTGMKRLGDFVQVANVASLPAKAHENCLYYCVAENILAKWNGAEWKQVNKQPTTEELKTLLGLGSMAYKSSVAEADLTEELAEKVNTAAEGNHAHANKTVLDGITSDKVAAWDAAEKNAKDHADGLNTAMNTRVEALEAIDHDHANKAELDLIATGDKAKWDAAAGKAHTHTFNETELNKIVEGDVAKWNGVVADHLTSADKTTLEDAIKEAKKAGTDANTNIEAYKVTNDARVLAVEEDIAEITGESGILAQAKSYTDGKDSAMNTRVAALETAAPTHALKTEVEAVDAKFANYKTAADQKAIDDAQDAEIAKKVDKVEGKSLVSDTEITKLAGVSEGANKVEKSDTNGNIKVDGQEVVVYTHPDKHAIADVTGLQDALDGKQAAGNYSVEGHKHVKADITDFAHTHTASEVTDLDATIKGYDYATKTEAQAMADGKDEAIAAALKAGTDAQADVDALETYVGTIPTDEKYADIKNVVAYIDKKAEETLSAAQGGSSETAASVKQQLDNYKSANDTRVETAEKAIDAIEADYLKAADKTELSEAIAAEKERAEGIEGGLETRLAAVEGDYLKAADKKELQDQITANANAITLLTDGADPDKVDGVKDLIKYVDEHGTEVTGMKDDIKANADAIDAINNETTGILKQAKDYADGLADNYAEAEHDHVVAEITDFESAVATKVESYGYATTGYADGKASAAQAAAEATAAGALATARTEITAEIDADVKVVNDALEAYKTANNAEVAKKANSADVYTKDETFTKDEVNALFTWGSF